MKKRLLAAAMTGMMALSAIMATPLVTSAKVLDMPDYQTTWRNGMTGEDSGIPIVFSSSNDDTEMCCLDSAFFETFEDYLAINPDEDDQDFINQNRGTAYIVFAFDTDDYNNAGDVLTLQLPITGTVLDYDFEEYWDYDDRWTISYDSNSFTFTCNEASYGFFIEILLKYGLIEKAPEGYFWFAPMENELAIAASEVSVNGGTATAKISGDYALSYDIMKWLEDHPGVTLEYTLTYEGNEYLIVIPGGSQLADTNIPWYGPKYLIKYFAQ